MEWNGTIPVWGTFCEAAERYQRNDAGEQGRLSGGPLGDLRVRLRHDRDRWEQWVRRGGRRPHADVAGLEQREGGARGGGAGFANVVRTRIFVLDIDEWGKVGEVHGEFFGGIRPATIMVEVWRLSSLQTRSARPEQRPLCRRQPTP